VATALTQAAAARRAALLQVESYQIFLDLTTGVDTARSRTEIRFSCREPGATTFADIDAVAVHEVVLNGAPVDPDSVTDGRLSLPGLAASNTLTVDATVALTRSGSGLTQYTDPADGTRYVLANCYPTAAPAVFCCFDQPDLRAAVTLIVTLPAGWTCVSNGEALHRPADGAAGVWRFSTVLAMKPYEFALCAGPFVTAPAVAGPDAIAGAGDGETASPTRLTVQCRPTLASSPGLVRIAAIVSSTLRYYEQLLGMRCPYDKLDIVFAPALGPLAMQSPAVMSVSETLLQRAADPGDDHVAVVLAHEAAHLWFGCLVEGGWWDDLWLAEGMASYLSYAAATAVLDQPDAWAEFGMSGKASAYQTDGLPGTQPISSPVDSAAHALTRPAATTYSKGTAAIRQLAALIGDESMLAGLHDYLSRHAWSTASLTDMIGCLSEASGCDLTQWASEWLTQPGVNALRPEIVAGPDGVLTSLAIVQDRPETDPAGPLRTHRLTVGIYQLATAGLRCDRRVDVTASGDWTHVPELTGIRMPAAIILNDADLTFATIGLDPRSWQALVACAMDLGDPLAESVCWGAAWHKVQLAELDAAEFAAIVARRIITGRPATGFEQLLDRALVGTGFYTSPTRRAAGRRQLAAAALSAAERAQPASRDQLALARAYARCADSDAQLGLLRFWLDGRSLPSGLVPDLDLRGRILASLSARGLAADADLAAYVADDPAAGDIKAATWRAMRPDGQSKHAAWAAALAADQSPRLARANAEGIWVAGQEDLMSEYRDRYFAEALPALSARDARGERLARRLADLLFPVTLDPEATIEAVQAALGRDDLTDRIRTILRDQQAELRTAADLSRP